MGDLRVVLELDDVSASLAAALNRYGVIFDPAEMRNGRHGHVTRIVANGLSARLC